MNVVQKLLSYSVASIAPVAAIAKKPPRPRAQRHLSTKSPSVWRVQALLILFVVFRQDAGGG
jgi:hypothetical protein